MLTGEFTILRADILYDPGKSPNPAIDIGQIEGGYVQGVGFATTEEVVYDDAGAAGDRQHLELQASVQQDDPARFPRPAPPGRRGAQRPGGSWRRSRPSSRRRRRASRR